MVPGRATSYRPSRRPLVRVATHSRARGGTDDMTNSIERLQADAEARLRSIADEFGAHSTLAGQCQRVWLAAEGQAVLSLLHDDPLNAEVVLSHALQVLEHAPAVARRAELAPHELTALMRYAV